MSKTILVVDDFAGVRNLIKSNLEKAGYKVIIAEDGNDALKHFNGQKIDLLITDYNMPVMSGLQLVHHVKGIDLYKFMPILMLTTETREDKKQAVLDAGITGWIHKPFEISSFMTMIKRAIG